MQALARQVTAEDLDAGCIYPDVRDLRNISLLVARAVAQKVRCTRPRPACAEELGQSACCLVQTCVSGT